MIAFLTIYLGLIAGRQAFALRVDPAVRAIRLLLDGREVATIAQPPWKADVDLGTLQPHEIVAIGFDADGKEIARSSQILNLPRPQAEVQMVVHRNAVGTPASVEVQGRHMTHFAPRATSVQLDGTALAIDRNGRATLPPLDMKRPHDLSAEMTFADGTVARREVVFGGEFAETVPTELTPLAVDATGASDATPAAGCFVSDGTPLRLHSIEKPPAIVYVVRDPDPSETRHALKVPMVMGRMAAAEMQRNAPLHATMELVSPVPQGFRAEDQPTAFIFPRLRNRTPETGLFAFVTTVHPSPDSYAGSRRWADAVAAAAVQSVADGRRRVVILILGSAADASRDAPADVRRYLETIGVPLFVWSVKGPRPDLAASWGDVEDVSSKEKFEQATKLVSRALDDQRIAWLYAGSLTAIHARVREGCGYTPLARP